MRNIILFFATSTAILLLSCGSTGKIAKSAKEAEIKAAEVRAENAARIKAQEREAERIRKEKTAAVQSEAFLRGKSLYEQKILAGQSARNPIIVDSYRIKMDSANGIEVFISFFNNSGKTLKYVDFEVTPYNRVDDIARSTIDGASTKTIQVVDYIEPSKKYEAHFPPVWYNSTISYIKINSIKVTFRDGSTAVIPQKDIQTVFKSPEISFKLKNFSDLSLSLKYDIADNRLFIQSDGKGNRSLGNHEIDFVFDTDVRAVNLGSPRARFNGDYSITREYELDDVLISSARSGYMTEHRPSQMTPRIPALEENDKKPELKKNIFTDEELRQIRDFACIRYYVENMKKGLTADDFATEIPKSGSRIFFVRIDGDGPVIRAEAYRELPESDLRHAIGALLAGPMSSEARAGICSLIPDGTRLLGAGISNGVATLNFSEEFESNQRAGVEGYLAQLMQIVYTATEFDGVKSVQILIDGKKEDYLGEGVWIGSPLSRNLF